MMSQESLQQIQTLYQNGKVKEAQQHLTAYLKQNPQDAKGWWMAANIFQDPKIKQRSLQKVLALKPDFQKARRMLDQFNSPTSGPVENTVTIEEQRRNKKPALHHAKPQKSRLSLGRIIVWGCIGVLTVVIVGALALYGLLTQSPELLLGERGVTLAVISAEERGQNPQNVFDWTDEVYCYVEVRTNGKPADLRFILYQVTDTERNELDVRYFSDISAWAQSRFRPQFGQGWSGDYEIEIFFEGELIETLQFSSEF